MGENALRRIEAIGHCDCVLAYRQLQRNSEDLDNVLSLDLPLVCRYYLF
jgi:hypothetical protein